MKATSIDGAAGGFLRHRFVRALGASWNVLVVFGLLTLIVFSAFTTGGEEFAAIGVAMPIALAIMVVMFVTPVILGVAATSALTDGLHRRLTGFFAWVISLIVVALAPFVVLGAFLPSSEPNAEPTTLWQTVALSGLSILSFFIALEAFGWAWWQMTTTREGFHAARGWRPPIWRLLSTYRRGLGLPPFIANFGRGRVSLTALYFLVAVVNCGLVAAMALPIVAFADRETADDQQIALAVTAFMMALILLNIFGVGRVLDRIADKRATALYQKVREWDARAPIVFLRAFDQDDAKLAAETRDPLVKLPAGVGAARTLDEILLEHASPYGPVIAIGDPRDPTPPLGAARIFVPEAGDGWQEVVGALVGASKAVVMCPTTSAGVKWELGLIERTGAEARTIFLANPEIDEAETEALFAPLAPAGEAFEMKKGQSPIAAYRDPQKGWRVLTAKRRSVQTYTVALNIALQAMFGRRGEAVKRPKKQKR